jgi:hypothetical protein
MSASISPLPPWSFSGSPEVFQEVLLLKSIHAGPEARVPVTHELTVADKPLYRRPFPYRRVVVNIVYDFRAEDEIPAVDPAFGGFRLFIKFSNSVSVEADSSETGRRTDGSHCGELSMHPVEFQKPRDVYIGDSVAVSEHEDRIVLDPFFQPFETPSGLDIQAGVYDVDGPVGLIASVDFCLTCKQVD